MQGFEAERAAQTAVLQESRAFQQQVLDRLAAEQAQRDLMTTRVLDLLEYIAHRNNGGNSNGNGDRPADPNPNPSPDTPGGAP